MNCNLSPLVLILSFSVCFMTSHKTVLAPPCGHQYQTCTCTIAKHLDVDGQFKGCLPSRQVQCPKCVVLPNQMSPMRGGNHTCVLQLVTYLSMQTPLYCIVRYYTVLYYLVYFIVPCKGQLLYVTANTLTKQACWAERSTWVLVINLC